MPRYLLISTLFILGATLTACADEKVETRPLELSTPQDSVILEVVGAITNLNSEYGAQFDLEMLRSLPTVSIETHTSVTDGVKHFEGFLLRDLLSGLGADGETIRGSALNDYVVEIPVEDVEKYDVIVAHSMDGKFLSASNKGPLWVVYPRDDHPELQDIRYDYRWVWQLNSLEIK